MTEIGQLVFWVIAGAVGLWLMIALAGAVPLLMISRCRLKSLPPEAAVGWLEKVLMSGLVDPEWIAAQGFEPRGVFQVEGQVADPHMVVWQRGSELTYFCVYVMMGNPHNADFATSFDEGGLTTGTSRDGLMLPPRPGHWMQAFTVENVAQQWKYHAEGLEYLRQTYRKTPSTLPRAFEVEFTEAVHGHTAYIRSLPLWFLRIPYWYVVRRYGVFGKSIEQQLGRQASATVNAR